MKDETIKHENATGTRYPPEATPESAAKPFLVHPRPLGLPSGLSYDNVEDLIEALETPLQNKEAK